MNNIFLTIVMGPALGFMLYALCQFWLEERRLRMRSRIESRRGVTKITSVPGARSQHVSLKATREGRVVVITEPLSRRAVGRHVA